MDEGTIMTQGLTWTADERQGQPRRPRSFFARVLGGLAWIFCGLVAIAVYTNVIVDDAPLRERAESMARAYVNCVGSCRVTSTQIRRSVVEYRAELEIDSAGSVEVVCRRAAIFAGEQRCVARSVRASHP